MENPTKTSASPNALAADIGSRLRLWRRSVRRTQDEMALLLHVNATSYRKYELGFNSPGAAVLTAACNQGLNVNWLLTGQPPMLLGAEGVSTPSKDDVLEQLCKTLENLRQLDPEKYMMLARGFIARSDEAGEHAALKRSVIPPPSYYDPPMPPAGYDDILSAPIDLPPLGGDDHNSY